MAMSCSRVSLAGFGLTGTLSAEDPSKRRGELLAIAAAPVSALGDGDGEREILALAEIGVALESRTEEGFDDLLRFRGLIGRGTGVDSATRGDAVVEVLSESVVAVEGSGIEPAACTSAMRRLTACNFFQALLLQQYDHSRTPGDSRSGKGAPSPNADDARAKGILSVVRYSGKSSGTLM